MTERGEPGRSLAHKMVSGTLWMVLMRWVIRVIGLVNTAIIARILAPEDFGLIALTMIAVDLCITLADGDVDMALIRARKDGRPFQDTGWTMKVIAGVITAAALWGLAPYVAAYFEDERIVTIMHIAALRPLILGFENIGIIAFRRDLNFPAEFWYLVAQRLITFVAVLGLVFAFRDYMALAWAMPVSASITVALSYWVVPRRPGFTLCEWRELWRFSRWQMLFNSARLVGDRCDQVIVGTVGGADDAGVYVVAADLATMPTREIMLPAGRALMPAYAKLADDPDALLSNFRTVLGFAAIIASAVGVGIACVAEDVVALVLGDQWSAAVPFVRWFGVFSALEGMWLMLDPVLIAAGRERALAVSNLILSALTVPAVAAVAVVVGTDAMPGGRIAVMAVVLLGIFVLMARWRWITLGAVAGSLWRPVLAALTMAFGVHALHDLVVAPHVASLVMDVATGAALYSATLFGLWAVSGRPDGAEAILADMAVARLRRLLRRRR